MEILASVSHAAGQHHATVSTNGTARSLSIPPKLAGQGSSVNGGELLCLALATCYCNDLFREAASENVAIQGIEVDVHAQFGGVGEPARKIGYRATILADAPEDEVRRLAERTDRVAEVHNTLRLGMPVVLERVVIRPATARPSPD